jgi:hypothetical protein
MPDATSGDPHDVSVAMNRWSSSYNDDELPPAPRPPGSGAWVLVFACGALLVISSLFWLSQGRFFDSAVYLAISNATWKTFEEITPAASRLASAFVRLYGALGISAGVLIMAVAATSYRRHERWAWYVFWVLPLCAALDLGTLAAYRALTFRNATWDIALLGLSLLGLIAPYQTFFPVSPPARRGGDERAHSP